MLSYLSRQRQEKVNAAASCEARIQRLTAGVLLEISLSDFGRKKPYVYDFSDRGKPFLKSNAGETPCFFSLSHCKQMSACAVAEDFIGVDVEQIGRGRANLVQRFFCEEEIRYLQSCLEQEWDETFTLLWTAKEAISKCLDVDLLRVCKENNVLPALLPLRRQAAEKQQEGVYAATINGIELFLGAYRKNNCIMMCASAKPEVFRFQMRDILSEIH